MKYLYIVGLGSNAQAEQKLPAMVDALLEQFGELCLSPVCRTSAEGDMADSNQYYLNAVASVQSGLLPPEFRKLCKRIETQLGRVRPSAECAADIDILACWEQPATIRASDFIQEPYYQSQADGVLDCLGLNSDGGPFGCRNRVPVLLADGRRVGLETQMLDAG